MAVTAQIVTVSATVTSAPTAPPFQQAGALVSVGGTTAATNSLIFYPNLLAVTAALSSAGNYVEVTAMATSFFAQGSQQGVFIVELGVVGSAAAGITALGTWITANPQQVYAYLVPATWDTTTSTNLAALAANYASATAAQYFFITTTTTNITSYTAKSCCCFIKSSGALSTEFGAASLFWQWLANNPSLASPAAGMGYRFVTGVTPWALAANLTTIDTILTEFGNIVIPASEGGLTNDMISCGTFMDGNQMMFWYSVDWFVINCHQLLAAAVINGSNTNPPLYYNQFGINTLLALLDNEGTTGISVGLALTVTFTAIPFATYTTAFPTNYANGIYNGFSCQLTPQLQFLAIEFFLAATNFT